MQQPIFQKSKDKVPFYLIVQPQGTLISYQNKLGLVEDSNRKAFNYLLDKLRERNFYLHIYVPKTTEINEEELYEFLSKDLQVKDVPMIEFSDTKIDDISEEVKHIAQHVATPNYLIVDSLYDFVNLEIDDTAKYEGYNYILCNPIYGLLKEDLDRLLTSIDDYSFQYNQTQVIKYTN